MDASLFPRPATVRKVPRPHQLRAIDGLREGMRRGCRRLLLVMLMGAGKTVTALEMMRLAVEKGGRCLFLTDRRMLTTQGAEEALDYGLDAGVILAGHSRRPQASIQFASRQTLTSWAINRERIRLPDSTIVVLDEAHKWTGTEARQLVSMYPQAWIIGLTATPIHGDGSGLGDCFDWLVQPIKPSELIAAGLSVPSRCYSPYMPDLKGVRRGADGDYSAKQLESRLNKANLVGDAVGWWKKLGENRQSVYFTTGIPHALAVRDEFLKEGIRAAVIDESTPDAERRDLIAELKAGWLRVIVNVDVMTEGVDVPELGCVGLLRPTKRLRRYLQMVGRGLRAAPGKQDCIVIDHGGCVLYHGLPETDHEWTLDPKSQIDSSVRKRMEDGDIATPLVCPRCTTTFTKSRVCPTCGFEFQRKAKDIGSRAGTLVGVNGIVKSEATSEVMAKAYQIHWRFAINTAIKRGAKVSMALAIFKNRFN